MPLLPPDILRNLKLNPVRCNCNDCSPDPRLACSYTGDEVSIAKVYIANAYKGDLILSPGGAGGTIGGLLHTLSPPQHYSHMGVMLEDFDLIRHCTESEERLNAKEYYSGDAFGTPAPTDGLNHDLVRYGWPGAITQTVEQAFMADRYGGHGAKVPGSTQGYTGADLPDIASSQQPQATYTINALSFDPVTEDGGILFYPALVVKPCPQLENDRVRQVLESIAEKAAQIYAHYRFYAYTDGSIGDNPSEFPGPPNPSSLISLPPWDSVASKWKDWADSWVSDPVSWVTNPTIGAVCSSFVWETIRQVNKDAKTTGLPRIMLDVEQGSMEPPVNFPSECIRAVPPHFEGDFTDKDTLDGLYFYSEMMRKTAANWLHDQIAQQVYDSFEGNVPGPIKTALDLLGRGAFIAAASVGVGAVVSLLEPVVGGTVGVIVARELIELLYDMPEDIANQICNAFAFDCINGFPGDSHCVDAKGNQITDIDSSNWRDAPGVGRAVSPDNIHMFWDPPISADSDLVKGVYGYNRAVALCVGVFKQPVCVLVPSRGVTTITGRVKYKGSAVVGAYVKAGCEHDITQGREAGFSIKVRAGARYKVIVRYEDENSGKVLYGEKDTGRQLDPGTFNIGDVCITDPPAEQRWVVVQGAVRVDDVHLTGADHDENDFKRTVYVQAGIPVFDESSCGWTYEYDPDGPTRTEDWMSVGAGTGDSNAQLFVDVKINENDLSVDVTLTGTLNPGDENMTHVVSVNVRMDETKTIPEFGLDTGDTFPDRAYFRNLTITNSGAQAI